MCVLYAHTHVSLNVNLRLWTKYLCFLWYIGHSQWHCEVPFSCFGGGVSTRGTLARANSPSSHFYLSLSLPSQFNAYTPFPPSIRSLVPCQLAAGGIQMWRETWTGKGVGERDGEGDRNPHPLLTEVIVQDLLDKPLDAYTQTIMRNKQWSPSRQLGPIVFYVHRCVCVCASGDRENQWTTSCMRFGADIQPAYLLGVLARREAIVLVERAEMRKSIRTWERDDKRWGRSMPDSLLLLLSVFLSLHLGWIPHIYTIRWTYRSK